MKPFLDAVNIVILGSWNPRIFLGEWVKENLCDSNQSEVEVAFSLNSPEASPRLTFEGIHLLPGFNRLEIQPASVEKVKFAKAQSVIQKILQQLGHTPVSAVGINFSFLEENDPEKVTQHLTLTDATQIDSEKYELTATKITRTYFTANKNKLNFSISHGSDNILFDFNYHSDIKNTADAITILGDDLMQNRYQQSLDFLKTVYDLDLEEEEDLDD